MTTAGSYRGIPLCSDTTGPIDALFVPMRRDLMQPYQPAASPESAGASAILGVAAPVTAEPDLAAEDAERPALPPTEVPGPSGSFPVTGTMGRTRGTPTTIESVIPPTGVDGIWVNYDAARWFLSGTSVKFDRDAFRKIGECDGFPVYQRDGNSSTIYIPVRSGRLASYSRRLK